MAQKKDEKLENNIAVLNRIKQALNVKSNLEISRRLGVSSGMMTWYTRESFPPKRLREIAQMSGCSFYWLLTGKGDPRTEDEILFSEDAKTTDKTQQIDGSHKNSSTYLDMYLGLRDLLIEKGVVQKHEWNKMVIDKRLPIELSIQAVVADKIIFVIDQDEERLMFLKQQFEKKNSRALIHHVCEDILSTLQYNLPDMILARCSNKDLLGFLNLFFKKRIPFALMNSDLNFSEQDRVEAFDLFWKLLPRDVGFDYNLNSTNPYVRVRTFQDGKKRGFPLLNSRIADNVNQYLNLKKEWFVFYFNTFLENQS